MIETELKRAAEALDRIALALEKQVDAVLQMSEPEVFADTGENVYVPTGEVAEVMTKINEARPQETDLSAMPEAPAQPGINGAEVMPPVTITKQSLWDALQKTYETLQTVGRGLEIGTMLAEYNAQHVDQINPEHYPVVMQRLQQLAASVGENDGS